jgi:hypothetical protein
MRNFTKKPTLFVGTLAAVATLISAFVIVDPFEKTFPLVSLFGSCSADNISGANKVESRWITQTGTDLVIQGWAADIEKKSVASEVSVLLIDSSNKVIGTWLSKYDTDRPDVAAAFNNPAMAKSGLNISIGAIALPGMYKIQFGSINDDQYQVCSAQVQIEVSAFIG